MVSHPSKNRTGLFKRLRIEFSHMDRGWKLVRDLAFILVGALVQALAMRLFLVPAQLVSGGISGIAQIVNYFTHWPIGLMVLIGNIPLFILGWRHLGGIRFAVRTAIAVVAFSLFTDLLVYFIPIEGVTQDLVLNCLYGGLLLGIGLGIVYRGKGTSGGSDILGRVLNQRLGISISQSYLIVDTLVVLAGGFAFNWEVALYGLVVMKDQACSAVSSLSPPGMSRSHAPSLPTWNGG
jgi:uncharacterized membrane-anchored protein YitT (DUF2179 family)